MRSLIRIRWLITGLTLTYGLQTATASSAQLEAVRTVHISQLQGGMKPHFEEMMNELHKYGCVKATAMAGSNPENAEQVILILRCTDWKKEAESEAK